MILSRNHRRRKSLLSPTLALAMLAVMFLSLASAPAIALAQLCAKPCCTAESVTGADDCCAAEAPEAPSSHGPCSTDDANGCEIERCCSATPEALSPPASPQMRGSVDLSEAMPTHAYLLEPAGTLSRRARPTQGDSPPAPPLRIVHCKFLI